jgi:hypothetical protein
LRSVQLSPPRRAPRHATNPAEFPTLVPITAESRTCSVLASVWRWTSYPLHSDGLLSQYHRLSSRACASRDGACGSESEDDCVRIPPSAGVRGRAQSDGVFEIGRVCMRRHGSG